MKSLLKKLLVGVLGWQVRRLRKRHNFKIIGVAGSIGKTSTKLAIAKMLASEKRVRFQEGNYNEAVSVPLVFFGRSMPALWNAFAWIKMIFQNEIQILFKFPFDFVVVELGTDAPGQIIEFRKYLRLDIAVLTAITPEHMEFFKSIDAVAEEEWSVGYFSETVFANKDLCSPAPENLGVGKIAYYGKGYGSFYKIENVQKLANQFSFEISREGKKIIDARIEAFSEVELYTACAAVAVCDSLKIPAHKIKNSLTEIKNFSGRMQKLKGIKNSLIIDDTYNSSPEALKLALSALYAEPAPQRVAILGMMNELGGHSRDEHVKAGKLCNPKFLDILVTVGKDANLYMAPAARENGCVVFEAANSMEAGELLRDKIKEGAVILAKGSQNGVFAEEALKPLLADKADFAKLVRQDGAWMKKKGAIHR